jgi:hypothetical protein
MHRSAAAVVVPFTFHSQPCEDRRALLDALPKLRPFQRAALVALAAQFLALNAQAPEWPSERHRVIRREASAIGVSLRRPQASDQK